MSICSINEIRNKEVINIKTGARLGFPSDIEIDLKNGHIVSLVVPGNYRLLGIFGKDSDTIIKWENIKTIGNDLIVIEMD